MVESQIPVAAWFAFAVAWVAGLSLFGGLFVITRRLTMSWRQAPGGLNLESGDAARLAKLLFGLERPPAEANVVGLLWMVRACWAVMVIAVACFAISLAGAA